jgi:alanine racemase
METAAGLDIAMTVSSIAEAQAAVGAAERAGKQAQVQVKIDTGMGRLGAKPHDADALIHCAASQKALRLTGVYSHYACADEDIEFTRRQWKLFKTVSSPPGVPRHICNSAGLLALPESAEDMIRPGIALYGVNPLPERPNHFDPVLSWKSRVVFVKEIPPGTTLSYGATFTAQESMRVATVAVGYGDGLFRKLSNRGQVLAGGRRCPILGRVTMDQILVDVTRLDSIAPGAEVVLLGRQQDEELQAAEMAQWAETIPYEIWTHIAGRVPRLYSP